jgi:hypothetical protein
MVWACVSERMAEDWRVCLYNINARMTYDSTVYRGLISTRKTCVVWRKERLCNVSVLQRVHLSSLVWWNWVIQSVRWLCYGLDNRGTIPGMAVFFPLCHQVQTGSGGRPSLLYSGLRRSFFGVKRPEHEVHHSLPYSAELSMRGSVPPLPRTSDVVLS